MKKNLLKAFILLTAISAVIMGCSANEGVKESVIKNNNSEQRPTLSFTAENNGKPARYEAVFKGNDLTELYIDSNKIPSDEIKNHKNIVDKKLKEIVKNDFANFEGFKFDSDKFKNDMEKLKEEMKSKKWEVSSRFFDSEEFKKNMDKLNQELFQLKDIHVDIDFNKEEIKNELKRAREKLKNINLDKIEIEVNLQMDKIDSEIKKLKKNMEKLDLNLEKMDKDLKRLDSFLIDLKNELIKDELIKSKDEDIELVLGEDQMILNGKPLSENLLNKYKELYKKHMLKDLKGKESFHIH